MLFTHAEPSCHPSVLFLPLSRMHRHWQRDIIVERRHFSWARQHQEGSCGLDIGFKWLCCKKITWCAISLPLLLAGVGIEVPICTPAPELGLNGSWPQGDNFLKFPSQVIHGSISIPPLVANQNYDE